MMLWKRYAIGMLSVCTVVRKGRKWSCIEWKGYLTESCGIVWDGGMGVGRGYRWKNESIERCKGCCGGSCCGREKCCVQRQRRRCSSIGAAAGSDNFS
jgi:hypothetical protein